MDQLLSDIKVAQLVSTVVYACVGIVIFCISIVIIEKVTPFSVRKEIEEDQNTALGIIIGSVFIGLAIILSAAIR